MPKPRLQWFKVWVGATRHEKIVTLDDRSFRAWVELLDAASEQPIRGRFTSCAAAAAIIRRPPALVRRLAQARLLDERDDGLWLHDWSEWQRWQADEHTPNGSGITHESLTNGVAIPNESPPESHTNGTGITHESHAIDTPPRVERAKTKTKRENKKETRELTPPSSTTTTPPSAFSNDELATIAEVSSTLNLDLQPAAWRSIFERFGSLNLRMEAFKQADWLRRNRKSGCSVSNYSNWLERELRDQVERRPAESETDDGVIDCPKCDGRNIVAARHVCPVETDG